MIEQRDPAAGAEHVGVVVIHGVGETEAGWINDHLAANLWKRPDEARGLEFAPYSEVYELPDRGRRRKDATFKAYVRRADVEGGPTVALIECFWADLSRVGVGPISGFMTLMRRHPRQEFHRERVAGGTRRLFLARRTSQLLA